MHAGSRQRESSRWKNRYSMFGEISVGVAHHLRRLQSTHSDIADPGAMAMLLPQVNLSPRPAYVSSTPRPDAVLPHRGRTVPYGAPPPFRVAAYRAATNPGHREHGSNGRTSAFSNGFIAGHYGAPPEMLHYVDCGLDKETQSKLGIQRASLQRGQWTRQRVHEYSSAQGEARRKETAARRQRRAERVRQRELEQASVAIQKAFRRHRSRVVAASRNDAQRNAYAERIAKAYRAWVRRGCMGARYAHRRQERSAVSMQALCRGYLVRCRRRWHTLMVQARATLHDNETFFAHLRPRVESDAAVRVQAHWRGWRARRRVRRERAQRLRVAVELERFATKLQAQWRARLARKKVARKRKRAGRRNIAVSGHPHGASTPSPKGLRSPDRQPHGTQQSPPNARLSRRARGNPRASTSSIGGS